jgi:hypothetical protein
MNHHIKMSRSEKKIAIKSLPKKLFSEIKFSLGVLGIAL